MPTCACILTLLLLGLFAGSAHAAEKTIGRQVQTWRPRALEPLASEASADTPSSESSTLSRPAWEAWIKRILEGQPVILFQPTWKGTWPSPRNPWTFSLTPGVRGQSDAGFGAEVILSGSWSLAGLKLEGDSHLLWAKQSGITSWRAAVIRGDWSFEGRGWVADDLRPGEWGLRATYRQPF
jgi:hypothetical protein